MEGTSEIAKEMETADKAAGGSRFTRLLQPAIAGVRTYWPAFLAIQGVGAALVLTYFLVPQVREACDAASRWRQGQGIWFAFVAGLLSGGVVPDLCRLWLRSPDLPNRPADFLHGWVIFGLFGSVVEPFYHMQAFLFGEGRDVPTLARKIAVDQFGYAPLVALPVAVLWFAWREFGYDLGATFRAITPRWMLGRVLPLFVANCFFWVPALVLVYALPLGLQYFLAVVLGCGWSLLLVFMARRPTV